MPLPKAQTPDGLSQRRHLRRALGVERLRAQGDRHRSALALAPTHTRAPTRRTKPSTPSPPALSSTTIRVTSGAASKMATSTAPCSVAADDGQPSQLPSRRSFTAPSASSIAEQLDVAAVAPQERPHLGQRSLYPGLERRRVQPVHQQQRPDQLVVGQFRQQRRGRARRRGQPLGPGRHRRDPTSAAAAPRPVRATAPDCDTPRAQPEPVRSARRSLAGSVVARAQASAPALALSQARSSALATWVGEWTFRSTLPLPRYMCTPQGRQGSKLRTARMISMPLKFSRVFSSKMGVSITASS